MPTVTKLKKRIERCCYQCVAPRLDAFKEAPDLESAIPFMDPSFFVKCATLTCIKLTEMVVNAKGGDRDAFRDYFFGFLGDLSDAMDRYETDFNRFQRLVRDAPAASLNAGINAGLNGSSMFGGVFGVLVGMAQGYFDGAAVERQIEDEGQRLQESFRRMLSVYDEAMGAVSEAALWHLQQ